MDKLIVNLTAAMVGNSAAPLAYSKVTLDLQNSSGRLAVEDIEATPRSLHRFTVTDAADLGYGHPYNLSAEQASLVLAVSCSLTNQHLLFSTLQPSYLLPSVEFAPLPSKVETKRTPTGANVNIERTIRVTASLSTCAMYKADLDEPQILNVASKLLAIDLFDTKQDNRTVWQSNVVQAVERYKDALLFSTVITCYKSLYDALEKAVNADGMNRKGSSFDAEVYALTAIPQSVVSIEDLRNFNNRVKHALRHHQDLATLQSGEARLGQLSRSLKRVADSAILRRI